jgi:4a-hydroxytetrahydrobiopterin dehydratase
MEENKVNACPIDLSSKKCKPCEGGTPPLATEEANKLLAQISGWELLEGIKIKKEFKFKDFLAAMEFVNNVANIANQENHHPAILISYNKVKITSSTHAIGGLSENDFILAAKIDKLISKLDRGDAMKKLCPICKKEVDEEIIKTCNDAHDWVVRSIRRDHPNWVASDGSCPKCMAYYNNLGKKDIQ